MSDEQHDQQPSNEPTAEQVNPEEAQGAETVQGEILPGEGDGQPQDESLSGAALKFAADAAYAVAGFAGLVGEKARAFYDEQRAEYAKTHPDVDSPGAKEFLEQLSVHLNRFVDDINRGFKDLSEKGRDVIGRREDPEAHQPHEAEPAADQASAEDGVDGQPHDETHG